MAFLVPDCAHVRHAAHWYSHLSGFWSIVMHSCWLICGRVVPNLVCIRISVTVVNVPAQVFAGSSIRSRAMRSLHCNLPQSTWCILHRPDLAQQRTVELLTYYLTHYVFAQDAPTDRCKRYCGSQRATAHSLLSKMVHTCTAHRVVLLVTNGSYRQA
jgi:hypothetical protein